MVAKLLHTCGVYLGPEHELLPASPDNADGFWEHRSFVELNESIFQANESAWDRPQTARTDWGEERYHGLRTKATELLRRFDGREPWGWKDPRNCLNLGFWLHLLPNLKVIVPIRHPLEVALSLRRRGFPSVRESLCLWASYNQAVLNETSRDSRIITHYDAYFVRPKIELERVLHFFGIPVSLPVIESCVTSANPHLRHGCFAVKHLHDARVPADVIELYLSLCSEAGWREDDAQVQDIATASGADPAKQKTATEVDLLGRALDAETLRNELQEKRLEKEQLEEELRLIRTSVQAQAETVAALEESLDWWMDIGSSALQCSTSDSEIVAQFRVLAIRTAVRRLLPEDANVVVISKGDPDLLKLDGCKVCHFPQAEDGTYAGCYPASSSAAIAHLEALRLQGADFLLIPSAAFWWLEHYRDFARHLRCRYRELPGEGSICTVFDLRQPSAQSAAGSQSAATDALAEFRVRLGRPLSILNWKTDLDLAQFFPGQAVFAPPGNGRVLPYLDHTVDVVAVPQDPELVIEARRVASVGVLEMRNETTRTVPPMAMEWLAEPRPGTCLSLDVFVDCPADHGLAVRYLRELRSTFPAGRVINLIVLGGRPNLVQAVQGLNGSGATIRFVEAMQTPEDRLAWNRAAAATSGDILILLDNVLPLDGWLSPILEAFDRDERAGIVGGKLISGTGLLHAAGGVVFADGSLANFGHGDYQVDDPLYSYVRESDFVGGLVAVRRSLFDKVGGFDCSFYSSRFAFADLCFASRRTGARVLYQPESTAVVASPAVDLSGVHDSDHSTFRGKWSNCLGRKPAPISWYDRDAWQTLAVRDAAVEVCP